MTAEFSSETSPRTVRASRPQTPREAALSRPLPDRVPWDELEPDFMAAWGFPNGEFMPEHLEIDGPTGSGKSHFVKHIVQRRAELRGSHVVIIATKPADRTLSSLGWLTTRTWPPRTGWRDKRKTAQVIFWPPGGLSKEAKQRQRDAIEDLLVKLWKKDSNIVVVFDEISYIQNELGLRTMIETYLREGRTLGITVVASTQRGQGVTRYMHSESTWTVAFAPKDDDDAERMAQILGNKLYFMRVLRDLNADKHEFVIVHNRTKQAYISSIPKRPRKAAGALKKESRPVVDKSIH